MPETREIILAHVRKLFGEEAHGHHSYCKAPFEDCTCKRLQGITYDTPLMQGGYLDSFSMVAVLIFLEHQFDIKIADKDGLPINFSSVDRMVEMVERVRSAE